MRVGVSELSRRGRRIEARMVGNGCSPDGATMYDGAMSYDRCTRRNPARRVDLRKKLIKLVGGHDAHPCYRGAQLAPSPSVVRKSVSTKSGRRSAEQSWPQPSRLGADLRRTRKRCL